MQNEQTTFTQRKKIGWLLIGAVVLFCALMVRVAWLQLVRGEEYSLAAREQQTSDSLITPKRGLIYDRNMKILANNISVETISISPENVRGNISQSPEEIADKIAEILELDEADVLKKIQKQSGTAKQFWAVGGAWGEAFPPQSRLSPKTFSHRNDMIFAKRF